MIQTINEIENSKIKSLFNFLCENVEDKIKTNTGKISKDREGNEKIEKSLKLKEGILENTSFFTVEKTEIEGRQEISVNKIEIDKTIAKIILSTYKRNIESTIIKHNYQIIDYDIEYELAKEHKIMTEPKDKVHKLNEIITKINDFNGCNQSIDFKKLSFFVIKTDFDGNSAYFFERFENIMRLEKTRLMKLLGKKNEKKFNTVSGDFLYLKYNLPCYLFDDEMFILKKYIFEDIFDYSEKYKKVCKDKENINFILGLDMCSDIKEFTDSLNTDNMNVLRKFSKVMQEKEMIKSLFADFNKIKELVKEHNKYSTIVIEDNKINIKKSNFQTILKLLNRDHLEHNITKEKFESNSKMKD